MRPESIRHRVSNYKYMVQDINLEPSSYVENEIAAQISKNCLEYYQYSYGKGEDVEAIAHGPFEGVRRG